MAWRSLSRSFTVIGNFMARLRNLAGQGPEKCKVSVYSEPWMAGFVADALKTADLPGAMTRAGVGWSDYLYARRSDPAFEMAGQEVDQIIRHAMVLRLECAAAQGDQRAIKLLAGGLAAIRSQMVDLGAASDPSEPRVGDRRPVRDRSGPCKDCNGGLSVECPHCLRPLRVFHLDTDQLPMRANWADSPCLVAGPTAPAPVGPAAAVRHGISDRAHREARRKAFAAIRREAEAAAMGSDPLVDHPPPPPNYLPFAEGGPPEGYQVDCERTGRPIFRRIGAPPKGCG